MNEFIPDAKALRGIREIYIKNPPKVDPKNVVLPVILNNERTVVTLQWIIDNIDNLTEINE